MTKQDEIHELLSNALPAIFGELDVPLSHIHSELQLIRQVLERAFPEPDKPKKGHRNMYVEHFENGTDPFQ